MMWRTNDGAIDLRTLVTLMAGGLFVYSAWLTSIVFSAANGHGSLLIAASMFPPVGVVHGVGVWFGGW
jgi:hypothetical protein